MKQRYCHKCNEPLMVDQDICQVCGANNPLEVPWYTWVIGPIIVLLLGWWLIDIDALKQLAGFE